MFQQASIFVFILALLSACGTGLTPTPDNTSPIQSGELTQTDTFSVINLPNEVVLQIFNQLSVKDIANASGVCKHWQELSEDNALWRAVRLRIHGDYSESEATKKQAIKHILRVYVNSLSDVFSIQNLVHKYKLNEQHPFKIYQSLLDRTYGPRSEMTDDYAEQANERALKRKIEGLTLANGWYDYGPDSQALAVFIDSLVGQGNEKAIDRKIEGLLKGKYGYNKNPETAVAFKLHKVIQ